MVPEPQKAKRAPRADARRNRERLLVAAAEVFRVESGGASLEAVARAAHLGIGTLYRHFPTRECLYDAAYRREVDQLSALSEQLAQTQAPVEALRLWFRAGVSMVATKRGMLAALAIAVDGTSDLQADSAERLTGAIERLSTRAIAAGVIRDDVRPEELLQAMVGMCLMGSKPGWEGSVVRMLDALLDGLAAPGGRG